MRIVNGNNVTFDNIILLWNRWYKNYIPGNDKFSEFLRNPENGWTRYYHAKDWLSTLPKSKLIEMYFILIKQIKENENR